MGTCPDSVIEAGDQRWQRRSRHRDGTPALPGAGFHLCPREWALMINSRSTWGLQLSQLIDVTVGALTRDPRHVVIYDLGRVGMGLTARLEWTLSYRNPAGRHRAELAMSISMYCAVLS